MLRIAILLAALGIFGCATDYSKKTPDEIAKQIQVSGGEFDNSKFYSAPPVVKTPQFGLNYNARLIASQDNKTGEINHALSVYWYYVSPNWIMFDKADFTGGVRLLAKVGARNVSSCGGVTCSYDERITALLTDEQLMSVTGDLRVRFTGRGGSHVVELPKNYVQGYLQGIGKLMAKQ